MGLKHVLFVTLSYKGDNAAIERIGQGSELDVIHLCGSPEPLGNSLPKITELNTALIRTF